MSNWTKVESLLRELDETKLSRRELLTRAAGLGLAASAIAPILTACGTGGAPSQAPTSAPSSKVAPKAGEPTMAAGVVPGASAPAPGAIELRLGCSNAVGDNLQVSTAKFAEIVNQKANGKLIIHNFGQSLGVEQQLAEAVRDGSVDFGNLVNGTAGVFTDAYLIYDLPFLFRNYDDQLNNLENDPEGKAAVAKFEKDLGVKVMFVVSYGSARDIETKRQVKVPADIKGMKIRTVSTPVDMTTFKVWGANPSPIDWGQTYAAVQQGVVDGIGVPPDGYYFAKYQEIIKYYLRIGYQSLFSHVYMNQKKFDSLSPELQKILLDSAEEARQWNRKYVSDSIAGILKKIEAAGVTIYTPTDAEYAQWVSVREAVWADVATQYKGKMDLAVAQKIYQKYNK